MSNQISNIIILGGGTSGWLSALFLTTVLNRNRQKNNVNCQITLIESSDIPTVGVGEATIQNIRDTFKFLELDEEEWMLRCNATFKIAIKFVNWSGLANHNTFWHPFGDLPSLNNVDLSHYLLRKQLESNSSNFNFDRFLPEVTLCKSKKSPKTGNENPYSGKIAYGYHLDAGLLANYLKEKAIERDVKHIVDNVTDVALTPNGFISHLQSQKKGKLDGDLFIDCSGFRGVLINQALQEPFISYADSLFCDRAIAMTIPSDDAKEGINPYTTATALGSGWAWHTPLFGRSGNGYVYSSAFISPEDAEQEFRKYLGEKYQQIQSRHLRMRVGKTRNTWVKNCISIGLSSGFIEPLESTGIFLIEVGLQNLLNHFPDKTFNPVVIKKYNQVMTKYYEEIRDFIVSHYCITQREDTSFWKANKYHSAIPDSLQEKLEFFQVMFPNFDVFDNAALFEDYSYFCILAGMNFLPQQSLPILDYLDITKADKVISKIQDETRILNNNLPDHYEYLLQLRNGNLRSFRHVFGNNSSDQMNKSEKTLVQR